MVLTNNTDYLEICNLSKMLFALCIFYLIKKNLGKVRSIMPKSF